MELPARARNTPDAAAPTTPIAASPAASAARELAWGARGGVGGGGEGRGGEGGGRVYCVRVAEAEPHASVSVWCAGPVLLGEQVRVRVRVQV
jgi:hypothetical protein